jgi:MoCo/4Fe-4S cofactor protein with predicted Tat translocation signal
MASKDSKLNFAQLRERILSQGGKNYWRSVEEFAETPEFEDFVKGEFPLEAENWDNSVSRRNFIKVMGASLALAGLSGCVIQPPEKVVPYVKQAEEYIPGKALYYATAMTHGGTATGLLARSNDFRPTKLEGNPSHPQSLGATDVLTQAALLGMYDPDRSQEITYRGEPKTWGEFVKTVRASLDENRKDGGAGIRFLTETITSPTVIAQFKQISAELPNAKWFQYDPLNRDNATAGAKMAFGSAANTVYNFDKAERILSLDSDFLSGFNVRQIKDFTKGRTISEEKMNRLYAVETTITITGAKADHRLAVKPSQVVEIAKAVAKAVGVGGANSTYSNKWVDEMAKDLVAHQGKSLVIVGDNQPPFVHAIAHVINSTLKNVGTTVTYTEPLNANAETLQIDGLKELIKTIDGGAVKMLVVLGGNPFYNTPSDLRLNADRMKSIPLVVRLGQHADETSEWSHWHVSEKHFLETWSDTRAFDGTVAFTQPLTKSLYDGRSISEIVQLFAKENSEKPELDILKDYWKANGLADEKSWRKAVHLPPRRLFRSTPILLVSLKQNPQIRGVWKFRFCPIRAFTTGDLPTTVGYRNCRIRLTKLLGKTWRWFRRKRRKNSALTKAEIQTKARAERRERLLSTQKAEICFPIWSKFRIKAAKSAKMCRFGFNPDSPTTLLRFISATVAHSVGLPKI